MPGRNGQINTQNTHLPSFLHIGCTRVGNGALIAQGQGWDAHPDLSLIRGRAMHALPNVPNRVSWAGR